MWNKAGRSPKDWTEGEVAALRKLALEGLSRDEMAREVGRTRTSVIWAVKHFDVESSRGFTQAERAIVSEMVAEGYSDREIGEWIGRTPNAVIYFRRRHKIASRVNKSQKSLNFRVASQRLDISGMPRLYPLQPDEENEDRIVEIHKRFVDDLKAAHPQGPLELRIKNVRSIMTRSTPALPNFSVTGSHF